MRAETLAFLILAFLASTCSAFDISPSNPQIGDKITITGTAVPGEQLNFRSGFSMDLPVSNGQYEYETSVEIPQTPNKLTVTARNVKDMNLGVKMIIWITKRLEASGGTASISQSNVPPGRYDLKMFGTATDGASKVAVEVDAETAVLADSSGKYSLIIDTSGIPRGDYRIEGGGDFKIVHIGGTSSTSSSGESSAGHDSSEGISSLHIDENAPGKEITSDVIAWYAGGHGLDPENTTQYTEAERQLMAMTSGGYWKVIARGEPFTEKAGNCEDKYCLVRGKGACTTCRYEEMLAISNKPHNKTNITENFTGNLREAKIIPKNIIGANGTTPNNMKRSQGGPEEKGFFSRIIDWFLSIIGGWVR
ncbi:MAG: hypothetical protein ACE14P_02820 [Methanotrichaceae archaeon]